MKKIILSILFLITGTISGIAQLPSVQLKDLNSKTIDTSTLNNDGKPFIISFFAFWCKPCLRELEAIKEVYEDWQEETGVKLYAVSIDDAQNSLKVGPEVRAKAWPFEILLDPNSEFKRILGVSLIPAVFIVDGKGKIVSSRTGYTNGAEKHLIEEVRKLLKKEIKFV
jgi:thiol-disulfide isomerase/thioredoxin